MREHMRTSDRALSNIEGMPEGFNALRRLHEQIQVRQACVGWGRGKADTRAEQYVAGFQTHKQIQVCQKSTVLKSCK